MNPLFTPAPNRVPEHCPHRFVRVKDNTSWCADVCPTEAQQKDCKYPFIVKCTFCYGYAPYSTSTPCSCGGTVISHHNGAGKVSRKCDKCGAGNLGEKLFFKCEIYQDDYKSYCEGHSTAYDCPHRYLVTEEAKGPCKYKHPDAATLDLF